MSLEDIKSKVILQTKNKKLGEEKKRLIDAAIAGLDTVKDKSDAFKLSFATDLMESANEDSEYTVDCFELAISMYLEGTL